RTIALPGPSEDFAQRVGGHTGRVSNLAFALALSPGGRRLYVPHVLEDTGADIAPAERFGGYGAGASQPIVATVTAVDAESEELNVPSDASVRGNFSFSL